MKFKRVLTALLCSAMVIGTSGISALADDYDYAGKLEELGYTFSLSGVVIEEAGYYKLDGTKVETEEEAQVQVTDPVNKKMKYLNGTTWQNVDSVFDLEHTDWEKEAVGVYVAGVKITETGYYNNDGSAADDEGPVYVDIDERKITLNGANINHVTGEMGLFENIKDTNYPNNASYVGTVYDNINGVPGVLVVTEDHNHNSTRNIQRGSTGKANFDSFHYWMSGYTPDYKFASIALGIMADDAADEEYEEWTLELVGENTITVENTFSKPMRLPSSGYEYYLDSPAYGIFAEANLTIIGTGSLDANVDNQWDYAQQGYMDYFNESTVGAVWSAGDLDIEGGTITAETSSMGLENDGYTMTGINTVGTIGAAGNVTISGEDTKVEATATTSGGIAVLGGTSVTITDGANVEAESSSDIAGAAIAASVSYGWYSEEAPVTISDGAKVTATAESTSDIAELANGVGIAGSDVNITDATVAVEAQVIGVQGENVTISGGEVTVEVSHEEGAAVEANKSAAISSGTYNTAIPENYIAENSAIVNDVITNEIPEEWAIKLGSKSYYTDASYAQTAIDKYDVDKYAEGNNVIYFNESVSVSRDGLSLGDVITLYVKHGETVEADFTGDRLMAQLEIVEGAEVSETALMAEAVDGYDAYVYTMVVNPEEAYIKVVREGAEDKYFLEFGYTFYADTAWGYAQEGDTIVILDDMSYTNTTNTYSGGWIDIEYPVTIDLNGHTLSSNQLVFSVGFRTEGTVTITDSSENKTGAVVVVNDRVSQAAVANGTKSTIIINGGSYSTNQGEVVRNSGSGDFIINDGEFFGGFYNYKDQYKYTIYGGTFDEQPAEAYLAEGYATAQYSDGRYGVVKAETVGNNTITVEFEKADKDEDGNDTVRGEDIYNINLVADTDKVVNRLNSADLTFALTQISGTNAYEIVDIADDNIAVGNVEGDRYEFHFETKTDVENDTASSITIAQVKVTGYGKYSFAVAEADTNAAHATEALDNIVDTFIPGGDAANGEGVLNIGTGTGEVEIFAPTQNLTIKVAFPNTISNNELAYQTMNVTVTGEDITDISVDLGSDNLGEALTLTNKANAEYTVAFDKETCVYTIEISNALTANTAYNVTVIGEGYRTARYTVNTQETDKTLNFWNNVKDNAFNVEEGKDSSAKTVTYLAGDIVKDGTINVYDLSAVVSYFGEINLSATNNKAYVKYDLDRNGKIDSKDVAYVLASWGN